jgi:hypothetical protein
MKLTVLNILFTGYCSFLLTSCSENPSSNPPLYVIGNSITFHGPLKNTGWTGNWGMAASEKNNDFAHKVGAALNMPVTAINFSELEQKPLLAIPKINDLLLQIPSNAMVIVELGDNLLPENAKDFNKGYGQLLSGLSKLNYKVCLSTWWARPEKDEILKINCEKFGFHYVDIGDVRGILASPGYKIIDYGNAGFTDHPQDFAMKVIAERIILALK